MNYPLLVFDVCSLDTPHILSGEIDTRTFVRPKKKRGQAFGDAINDENRNTLQKRGLYSGVHNFLTTLDTTTDLPIMSGNTVACVNYFRSKSFKIVHDICEKSVSQQ